jgi:hypothetical protein
MPHEYVVSFVQLEARTAHSSLRNWPGRLLIAATEMSAVSTESDTFTFDSLIFYLQFKFLFSGKFIRDEG